MKKPWSITTTVRNPERLRDFLAVLCQLENEVWDDENQKKYQILLIQKRIYGFGSAQFLKGLSQEQIDLIEDLSKDISIKQAREIFDAKNFEDPAMRGRQSVNVLKKFGFAVIENKKIKITDLGRLFLGGNFNLGEVFFRSFLKWQIPNPDNRHYPKNGIYDIKPFLGTLHLINAVNQKEVARNNKPKGISKKEFSLFVPTLVHHKDIESYAEEIILLRDKQKGESTQGQEEIFDNYSYEFARNFLGGAQPSAIKKLLNNLRDYGDNTIRYFRLTGHIHIRGSGFYVDLEPRRSIEINSLLSHDTAQAKSFQLKDEYFSYISDITLPRLPWETRKTYLKIASKLIVEIHENEEALGKTRMVKKPLETLQDNKLKEYIVNLRAYRRQLQEEKSQIDSQSVKAIKSYIESLENIFAAKDRPAQLEKLSTLGLHALDDALKIQPNYPVGDDNEPTFTAPANTPDIECFYDSFNAICEVTLLSGRNQWYNEGQPVMRHLRDFEKKNNSKPSYCLFIAPKLHRDTINTYWTAIKHEYEGKKQKIIPITIGQFIMVLEWLLQIKNSGRCLKHTELSHLYDEILRHSQICDNAIEWKNSIPIIISNWGKSLVPES